MYYNNCGTEIENDSHFCTNCGNEIDLNTKSSRGIFRLNQRFFLMLFQKKIYLLIKYMLAQYQRITL